VAAALVLIAALTPGLWWRSEANWEAGHHPDTVHVESLPARTPASWPAGLELAGAWHLSSRRLGFGGFSALLATDHDTLTAISDYAAAVRFRRPDLAGPMQPKFGLVATTNDEKQDRDIEAATWDPLTGTRWFAYEGINSIRRIRPGERLGKTARPAAMRHWPRNGGAESMTRLPDGRFIVLAEDAPWLSAGGHAGLLFPGDPVAGRQPLEFTFRPPIGYSPSDMAALPDGRTVILLRVFDPPRLPFLKGMLIVGDPARIVAGQDWPWSKLADLDSPAPRENYEGLAVSPAADGVNLWVISDDNYGRIQRTLLLKLHWRMRPTAVAQ
jgi:hypothetical protein